MKRLRGLSGFIVDLSLGSFAWILGLHPVEDFLRTNQHLLPWSVTAVHVAIIPLLFVQMLAGHTKDGDFMTAAAAGTLDERLSAWSTALVICASFIVPGVLTLGMPGSDAVQMMTAVFGPFGLIVACGFVVVRLEKHGVGIPNIFGSAPRRLAVMLLIWGYLALMETTMVLAAESKTVMGGVFPFVGAALSYLPVRLYLFYATEARRVERLSVMLSFASLIVRLAVALP